MHGHLTGLKASQRKSLRRLGDRRVRSNVALPPDLAAALAAISFELHRTVGLLVDRGGRIEAVVVGDARRLYLPDIGRARGGGSRFRGLRLLRTHFGTEPLSRDDLTDLSRLRLDVVVSVHVTDAGRPGRTGWAHLVPDNPTGQLWSSEIVDHVSRVDFPFDTFIQELEAEFEAGQETTHAVESGRAMIVYVRTREDWTHEARLVEMHELCRSAGVEVVETYVQSRMKLDPKFAIGSGALEEIELRCLQLGAEVLIFGQDLTPAQSRSIAERTQLRVIDRTQLILDIFAQRAQSRVGRLQVELAQLKYRLPRLSGRGTSMSRLAGGIGGRGPGETRLEIDRRRARDRIAALDRQIEELRSDRALRRRGRTESGLPIVSIVGYTNAGKSTLLNTLTQSTVRSEDRLFATLDPTSRRLRFPEERALILTDTVGFIRDLPQELREAFRATLEELEDADLLLHVVDASDPDHEEQIASTVRILAELGLEDTPRLRVFNKADRLTDDQRMAIEARHEGVFVSAVSREGARPLIDVLDRWLLGHGHAAAAAPAWQSSASHRRYLETLAEHEDAPRVAPDDEVSEERPAQRVAHEDMERK